MYSFNDGFVVIGEAIENYISKILGIKGTSKESVSISFRLDLLHVFINGGWPLTVRLSWLRSCLMWPRVGFAYVEASKVHASRVVVAVAMRGW